MAARQLPFPKIYIDKLCAIATFCRVMKKFYVAEILLTVLIVIALLMAWFSASYYFASKKLAQIQPVATQYDRNRMVLQNFSVELEEYRKKNPGIDSILQPSVQKPGNTPASSSSTAKPGAR